VSSLFESAGMDEGAPHPLADRLRPGTLDEVVGQNHILDAAAPLGRMVKSARLTSMVLWGPPGTGKTTIARLLADVGGLNFVQISAIFSGVADLRKVFDEAKKRRQTGQGTLLFVDEIHRFNRSQQDGFLPHVEDGTIILVGATTENPSFELNAPLLSRLQVLVLNRLDQAALGELLERAETLEGRKLALDDGARASLCALADGDGRYLLNCAEVIFGLDGDGDLDSQAMGQILQKRAPQYDKDREGHYNLISALHKSLRGSDVDASLYWLTRMLVAGEDPLFIIRRLVRFASEDIGLADPVALSQTLAAKDAYRFLGSPEGELAIVQACIYLASAPKSNAAYKAEALAKASARNTGSLTPPMHILNAPTSMMKDLGYGKDYAYDHDSEHGFSGAEYFPEEMTRQHYYQPLERGFEREVKKRMDYWSGLRKKTKTSSKGSDK
jgi:putative ATPase